MPDSEKSRSWLKRDRAFIDLGWRNTNPSSRTRKHIAARVIRGLNERLTGVGLVGRTLALVAVGLSVMLAGFVMLSAQARSDSTASALQERVLLAQSTARDLDDRLSQVTTVASAEASDLPTTGGAGEEETRAAWRSLRMQFGPVVQRLVAVDNNAQVLWTSPFDASLLGLDLSAVSPLMNSLKAHHVVIDGSELCNLPPQLPGPGRSPTVSIFSPMASPEGGALLIIVDLSQPGITDLLRNVALGQTGYTEVVDHDGEVLASTRPSQLGTISDHNGYFTKLVQQDESSVGTCHDCHSTSSSTRVTEDVLAFAPMKTAPFGVTVRESSSEVFALPNAIFYRSLIFGSISFAIALAVSLLITIRLVRPVKALTAACQRISEGDLSAAVPPMGGGEVRDLADSFETMRFRLAASQEEISRWANELEQRVAERTAQLEEARDNLEHSRDFLATLFDSLEDQLAVIDRDFQVVEVNRALLARYQDGESPIGQPCSLAFCGAYARCQDGSTTCPAARVWQTGRPARVTQVHRNGQGRQTYLDIVASPILDKRGQVVNVLAVARDVTESKRLEERVLRTSEELGALVSLSSTIARSMDLKMMLVVALDHVLFLMGSLTGGIVLDKVEGEAEPTVVTRGMDAEEIEGLAAQKPRLREGSEVYKPRWKRAGMVCVPIVASSTVLGQMILACPSKPCFGASGSQILMSIGSQLAVAVENARLYGAVRNSMRKYIEAQEEERKRIARELHDETAQLLTALSLTIEAALQTPATSVDEVRALMATAQPLTERVSTGIDRLIRDLRPSLLDDLGLVEALGWYADHRLKPLGIRVAFDTPLTEQRLRPELETTLFRVAQEAMSNVAQHAKAENVTVAVELEPEEVTLEIEDDGCGFDVEASLSGDKDTEDGSSFGLLGMRERVSLLGGTLEVESRVGQGTRVRAVLPM